MLINSIIKKILIYIIIISFLTVGILQYNTQENLVTFKYLEPITLKEFTDAKKQQALLSKQNNSLSNYNILQEIIYKRLTSYLIKIYNVDISKEYILDKTKDFDVFKSESNKFDKDRVNKIVKNFYKSEENFINYYKKEISNYYLTQAHITSIKIPNIISKIHEASRDKTYNIDIGIINLQKENDNSLFPKPSNSELMKFYNKNIDEFQTKPFTKIGYIQILKEDIINKFHPTISQIKEYWEKHYIDFKEKNLEHNKNQIIEILKNQYYYKKIKNLTIQIEDQVASGKNIQDLSKIHNTKITYKDLIISEKNHHLPEEIKALLNDIKDMKLKETSYPIEIHNGLIIIEILDKKKKANIPFKEVKSELLSLWYKNQNYKKNYEIAENFNKSINNKKKFKNHEFQDHVTIEKNITLTESSKINEDILPKELKEKIATIKTPLTKTDLIISNNKAYIGFVNNITYEKVKNQKNHPKKLLFLNKIRESYINDIIEYAYKVNKVNINHQLFNEINNV